MRKRVVRRRSSSRRGAGIPSPSIRQIQASRSERARKLDAKLKAKLAKSPEQWAKHPNRYDLKGVDYPERETYATHDERKRIIRAIQRGRALGVEGWIREEDLEKRYPKRAIHQLLKEGQIYSPRPGFYALTKPDIIRQVRQPPKTEAKTTQKFRDPERVKMLTSWIKRIKTSGLRDPNDPFKMIPPSDPRVKQKIRELEIELAYAKGEIDKEEYHRRYEKLEKASSKPIPIRRMSYEEVLKSQRGMDKRVAGWKAGKYRIFLLHSQIWNKWWYRIEDRKGKLIKSSFRDATSSPEETLAKIGDEIEKITRNKKAAEEFRRPLIMKKKERELARKLVEAKKDSEVVREFNKRFRYGQKIEEYDISHGALMDPHRRVALVLDEKSIILKQFQKPKQSFSAKITPKKRAKIRTKTNILIGEDVYNGEELYKSLMVLDTKQPIKFKVAKTGVLLVEDHNGTKIAIAPAYVTSADQILHAHPLSKILTGKPWKKQQYIRLLERKKAEAQKELIETAKKIETEAKTKSYLKTKEDRERYINAELGHRRVTETYLSYKEKIKKLKGEKVSHEEIWEPYLKNRGIWKEGKLLI